MGRWAEVYFTSPPEKREQAVLDLLRELRGEGPALDGAAVRSSPSIPEQAAEPVEPPASRVQEVLSTTPLRCPACGWENPASHKFCGMCGKPVAESQAFELAMEDTAAAHPVTDRTQDELATVLPGNEPQFARSAKALYQPALSTDGGSPFHRGRTADGQNESEDVLDPPESRSYRVYWGISLAVVMVALAYVAWRSAQTTSQSSQVEPQTPPAVVTRPTTPAAAPLRAAAAESPDASSHSETTDRTPPANRQASASSNTNPVNEEAGAPTSGDAAAGTATPGTEKNPASEAATGNGAQELAIAQGYLNGTNGAQRNSTEAAKWLWKAMAKQNASATLLLADLYLKGDGVPKNCDQARVLLDSAALKGMKDAGDRLQHLQAFGCD